jgi:lipoprotein-releasing system permease protein
LLDAIPVEVIWSDVVLVAVVSLAFSFIATVYPAKRAAAVPLIEAIREE